MVVIIPSKPLTLDNMRTSDFAFRKACYHQKRSYKNMIWNEILDTLEVFVNFFYVIPGIEVRNLQGSSQDDQIQRL